MGNWARSRGMYLLAVLCSVSVICAMVVRADDETPSLSVGSIVCASPYNPWVAGWDNRLSAIRGMLISELAQNYHCHVQTRWQGLELVTEQSLTDLAYIDRLRVPANQIQTADILLAGHFDEAQKGVAVSGRAICINMRTPKGGKSETEGFEASSVFDVGRSLAKAEAATLLLPKVFSSLTRH